MQKTILLNCKEVNKIGIGTWMMGGGLIPDLNITFADYDNDEEAINAIRYSISKGQNHIDTAQMYGAGHTEEIVGEAIKGIERNKLFIASKVWKSHMKRSSVPHAVEQMLKRLQIDYLDLVYIHSPNHPFPMEEYMSGLNDVVDQGLAKGLAVSNFNIEQLKKAQLISKHPILANQMLYNILERSDVIDEMLDYCTKENIVLVAYRPVERSLLADHCTNEIVLSLAKKYNKTPAQIAINWLITRPNIITIPKAIKQSHIDENLGAFDFELSSDDIRLLSEIKKA